MDANRLGDDSGGAASAIVHYAIGRLLVRQADIEAAAGTWGLFSIIHRPGRYLARYESDLTDQLGRPDRVPDLKALAALAWGARGGRWPVHTNGLTGLALVGTPHTIGGPAARACAVFDPHAHGHVLAADTGSAWHPVPDRDADCAVAQGLLEVLAALHATPGPARQ